ncbi:MAG: Potassium translocating ATPase, subunit [Pseudomonadota bacterium]|jgi:K+-transporting ATPase ATPase C chain
MYPISKDVFMGMLNNGTRFFLLVSMLLGFLYPSVLTGFAHLFFPWQAKGSLITDNGIKIGSVCIGQHFNDIGYFWGRPSTTPTMPYNPMYSEGSNLGPSALIRLENLKQRMIQLQNTNFNINTPIPFNLVSNSGSGLDPDISVSAARYQIFRVAKARQLPINMVAELVEQSIIPRTFHLLGEPRVNVLQLNIALNRMSALYLSEERNKHGKAP